MMRTKYNRIMGTALSILLATSMIMTPSVANAAKKAKLNKTSKTLYVGKTVQLKVKNVKGVKITWKSSKKSVASVSKKGKVRAKKKGSAKITATFKVHGKKKVLKCTIKVKKKASVSTTKKPGASPASTATSGSISVTSVPFTTTTYVPSTSTSPMPTASPNVVTYSMNMPLCPSKVGDSAGADSSLYATVELSSATVAFTKQDDGKVEFAVSIVGRKITDAVGDANSHACSLAYQIVNSSAKVVTSGTMLTASIKVGDAFTLNQKFILDAGEYAFQFNGSFWTDPSVIIEHSTSVVATMGTQCYGLDTGRCGEKGAIVYYMTLKDKYGNPMAADGTLNIKLENSAGTVVYNKDVTFKKSEFVYYKPADNIETALSCLFVIPRAEIKSTSYSTGKLDLYMKTTDGMEFGKDSPLSMPITNLP